MIRRRLLAFRDRLLTRPSFQEWARRNPLTRAIARRRASDLFDLCAGFVYSQILFACVRLDLFRVLEPGPCSVELLATQLGLTREAMLTLLDGAAALGLVEWRDRELCGLGRHGAALLGNPGLVPLIEHHALLYEDLRDPVALLQGATSTSNLKAFWAYGTDQVSAYTALMSASQSFIASEVLDAYDLRAHRTLLDVGGGDGTFCLAAAARAPDLKVQCFDLPAVIERTRTRFARAGLGARGEVFAGSFLLDPLPRGADIVSLVRVLHDHDDTAVMQILHAVRLMLPAHGTVLIAEPMAGTPGGERAAEAYFGFYLLAMGSGKPRTLEELTRLLDTAGFERPRLRPTHLPLTVRVVSARVK